MQSSSEINTVSKRAARAAGYSWGIAEEVGKCISSIEMFGIPGIENLNNYFKTIKVWPNSTGCPSSTSILFTTPSLVDGT